MLEDNNQEELFQYIYKNGKYLSSIPGYNIELDNRKKFDFIQKNRQFTHPLKFLFIGTDWFC